VASSYGARGRRTQPLGAGLKCEDGEWRSVAVDEGERVGVGHRAVRRTELQRRRSGADGDEVRADGVRPISGDFNVHQWCATIAVALTAVVKMTLTVELREGGSPMEWIKPKFEFIEMCSEVTSYLYHR
jgi:hypothetical protein